jgi:hypothetical protein
MTTRVDRRKWIAAGMPPELFLHVANKVLCGESSNPNWAGIARDLAWLLVRLERKQQHRLNRERHKLAVLDCLRSELEQLDGVTMVEAWKSVARELCHHLVRMMPNPRGRQAVRRGMMNPGPALPHETWKSIRPLALARLGGKADLRDKVAILEAMEELGVSDSNSLEYFQRRLSEAKGSKPR